LLLQCIRRTAARWGTVRVAIGRCLLLVVGEATPPDGLCPLCGRQPSALHCRLAGLDACLGCALDQAVPEHGATATIGVGMMAPAAPRAVGLPHSRAHSNRGDAARPSLAKRRQ
jgi:hypothetical protein